MPLNEIPPKCAHDMLLYIYDYMEPESRAPTKNILRNTINASDEDFCMSLQWLISQGLIIEILNPTCTHTVFCPTIPRYKYYMGLLTLLKMDFLFQIPLMEVLWERDSPLC